MYINFWYAMAESHSFTADKPTRVRRLYQNFVLFRDAEGQVRCLHDVCTHRGGSLGAGRMRDGHVECPYHGWQFDGVGTCKKIPSLGPGSEDKIPGRTKVDSYPVQEKFGIIFAFLGDLPEEERPPLMMPDWNPQNIEYPEDTWRWVTQSWGIKTNYERCVENGIDPSHNEYVHRAHGFMGARDEYRVNELEPVKHTWGAGFWHRFYAPPSTHDVLYKGEDKRTSEGDLNVSAGFNGPNQVWTYIHITSKNWMHQYLYETPIDDYNTQAFNISINNFLPADIADDEEIRAMNESVAVEDVVVLEDIVPVITPDNMTSEVMVPSDMAIVDYRKLLKIWDAKGWRIDTEEIRRNEKTKAYAIPSPRRRLEKGWVIEAVPLIPGTEAEAVKKVG